MLKSNVRDRVMWFVERTRFAMPGFLRGSQLAGRDFSVRLLVASAVIAVVICGCGQEEEELDRTKSGAFKLEKTCTHSIAC